MARKAINVLSLATLACFLGCGAAAKFVCPSNNGYFPDPDNCAGYYVCIELKPTHMPCAPGTLYDPKASTCMRAEDVICFGSQTTSNSPSFTTTQPPTTQPPLTTTQQPTTNPPLTTTQEPSTTSEPHSTTPGQKKTCPETGVHLIPDAENCTIFYFCTQGLSHTEHCAAHYGYNPLEERCTRDNNDCQPGGSKPTTPSPNVPVCPSKEHLKLANPQDCHTYYFCQKGWASLITCPVNYQFSEEKKTCVEAASEVCGDLVTPKPGSETCKGQSDGTLLPDLQDCHKFFSCNGGVGNSMTCPEGLDFSAANNICETPSSAKCRSSF